MSEQPTYGILISNIGTPAESTAKEIKKFTGRFLMDERIAPMNRILWRMLLQGVILPRRSKRNVAKYQKIWTEAGNPFTVIHNSLTDKLNAAFKEAGREDVIVTCGMSYSDPDIYDALKKLRDAGCTKVIVLPLYPQSAYSTTAAVHDEVGRVLEKLQWKVDCDLIDNYHNDPIYIQAIADSIRSAGFDPESNDRIMFSFHSIPMIDIEKGDTYGDQVNASCSLIAQELDLDQGRWLTGYQCRFDRGREWLKPYTVDVLSEIAQEAPSRLFFVCPNFAADCLETLYDIEHGIKPYYAEVLEREGRSLNDEDFVYVPCLNDSDAQVRALVEVLAPTLV